MKIISWSQNPHYRKNILYLEPIRDFKGRRFTRVIYSSDLTIRKIFRCTMLSFVLLVGAGTPLFFGSFRRRYAAAFSSSDSVCVKQNLTDYFWKKIRHSPSAYHLHRRALHFYSHITLSFCKKGELKTATRKIWTGASDVHLGQIFLSLGRNQEQLFSTFLFELINLSQGRKILSLQEKARDGDISPNHYAKEMERIEYKSARMHHQVVKASIESSLWSRGLDRFKDLPPSFKEDWQAIKYSDHANSYRKQAVYLKGLSQED